MSYRIHCAVDCRMTFGTPVKAVVCVFFQLIRSEIDLLKTHSIKVKSSK